MPSSDFCLVKRHNFIGRIKISLTCRLLQIRTGSVEGPSRREGNRTLRTRRLKGRTEGKKTGGQSQVDAGSVKVSGSARLKVRDSLVRLVSSQLVELYINTWQLICRRLCSILTVNTFNFTSAWCSSTFFSQCHWIPCWDWNQHVRH